MVNVGGPSKGCLTCIRRKIRCDRLRPACGQCQRSKRQCEGYRSDIDTMFRDQSQEVALKALSASQSQSQSQTSERIVKAGSSQVVGSSTQLDYNATMRSPRLKAETALVDFFANNFTCNTPNAGRNLFWMPDHFSDLLNHDVTRLSVQSVGAMALARLQGSSHYYREAQKYYGAALLSLGNFWLDTREIDKDAVLVTVLLLGFFEILASYDSSSSRQSWISHLGGLEALLQRRNGQFMTTPFGVRMILQTRSQIILNSLQSKIPVPATVRTPKLRQGVSRAMPPNIVQTETCNVLLIRLADLQAQSQSTKASSALIAELKALDLGLCRWMESVHPSWDFAKRPSDKSTDRWWDTRYDVYSAPVVAHVWNKMRAARIIVNDLIQDVTLQYSPGIGGDEASKSNESRDGLAPDIRDLVTDITATIPMYYRPLSAGTDIGVSADPPLLGVTYWLLSPLEVVGCMKQAPPLLRAWIVQCLYRINDTTGIVKAKLAADRVKAVASGVFLA